MCVSKWQGELRVLTVVGENHGASKLGLQLCCMYWFLTKEIRMCKQVSQDDMSVVMAQWDTQYWCESSWQGAEF